MELGFCDEILYENKPQETPEEELAGETEEEAADTARGEAQLYSSRMMDMAILNRLGISDKAEKPPDEPSTPLIGMDGKTADGAVPYQILINQLDFLK